MASSSDIVSLTGPHAFAWGCCIRGYHFLYVYGTAADYRAFRQQDGASQGDTLHKGRCASLAAAQEQATWAAESISELYREVGSVRVVNARERLQRWQGGPATAWDLPGQAGRDR